MYASSAWCGYRHTESKDRNQIDRLVARMKRRGFLSNEDGDATQFARAANSSLFKAICVNSLHVLSSLSLNRNRELTISELGSITTSSLLKTIRTLYPG